MNLKKNKSRLIFVILVLNIFCITSVIFIQNTCASNRLKITFNPTSIDAWGEVKIYWEVPTYGNEVSYVYASVNGGGYKHFDTVYGSGDKSSEYHAKEAGNTKFKVIAQYYELRAVGGYGGSTFYEKIWYDIAREESGVLQINNNLKANGNLLIGKPFTLYWTLENHPTGYSEYSVLYHSINGAPYERITTYNGVGLKSYTIQLNQPRKISFKVVNYADFGTPSGGMHDVETWRSNSINTFYDVDVKIMYDANVIEYLGYSNRDVKILASYIETALDYGFGQYFNIDFHTRTEGNWFIYDSDGYNPRSIIIETIGDYLDWIEEDIIRWDLSRSLPSGQGHGNKFDLLILLTYDPNLNDGRYGISDLDYGNYFVINLKYVEDYSWSSIEYDGLFSMIMHETGHCYGINGQGQTTDKQGLEDNTGDTSGYRKSVMDYYYDNNGYGNVFDSGNIKTILTNLNKHSN